MVIIQNQKQKKKLSDDLKSGREKRWLDTVASDSDKIKLFKIFFFYAHLYSRSVSKR